MALAEIYNLRQNKWEIWTTPPPISMMPKWRDFAPSRLRYCFGGGGMGDCCSTLFCPRLSEDDSGVAPLSFSRSISLASLFLILSIFGWSDLLQILHLRAAFSFAVLCIFMFYYCYKKLSLLCRSHLNCCRTFDNQGKRTLAELKFNELCTRLR